MRYRAAVRRGRNSSSRRRTVAAPAVSSRVGSAASSARTRADWRSGRVRGVGSAIAPEETRYSTYGIAQWCSGMYCEGGDAVCAPSGTAASEMSTSHDERVVRGLTNHKLHGTPLRASEGLEVFI